MRLTIAVTLLLAVGFYYLCQETAQLHHLYENLAETQRQLQCSVALLNYAQGPAYCNSIGELLTYVEAGNGIMIKSRIDATNLGALLRRH